jgi:protein SCO1
MRWQSFASAATTIATAVAVVYAAVTLVSNNLQAAQPPTGRWAARDFPNVALTTQDGQTVRFYDDLIKGKSVGIDLIYTDCKDECPLETARLVQVQKLLGERMGKDLYFYSISIDPRHDTPEVLKEYAEKFHVGPGWLFLTGDENDIHLIARKLGLPYELDTTTEDGHGPTLMLGDEPTGLWMQRSAEDNPRFLAHGIGTFFGWPEEAPATSYADAKPLDISRGAYVFQTRCVGCHTIGQGDLVGPDLAGVTARRDQAWLDQYLYAPDEMLASGDPIAAALFEKYRRIRMPNLQLDSQDVAALVSFLDAQSITPGAPENRQMVRAPQT